MKVTQLRVASLVAPALLFAALTGQTLAASSTPFTFVGSTPKMLTPAALAAAQKTETQGQASPDGKMLTFRQRAVCLVATTGPDTDMLSYRINGLRNPTLIVPRGATMKMLFVNTDDDMFHNIRFGPAQMSYPNMMTAYLKVSVGTSELPHKSETTLHGEELTLRAPGTPGAYVYLCTVRGHAQGGMVGKVVVQ